MKEIEPAQEAEKIMREYQENVFDTLAEFVRSNLKKRFASGYVVMPPRSGKTLVFTKLIQRLGLRTIVASPTLTILYQNYQEMVTQNPGANISIYADYEKDLSGDIIFTTYHSLVHLGKRGPLARDFVRLIIFDEAHRSLSFERSKIPENFDAICLGFTATDKFSEEKNVEKVFKNELYRMHVKEAVEDGILLPLRGVIVSTNLDLQQYRLSRQNALDEKMAEKLLNIEARNQVAREYYLNNLKGVPTVAFCVSIEHAAGLAAYFRQAGIRAEAVHSRISHKKRIETIKAFNEGKLDILCARDILIEGWDSGRVTAELNLRPTYSWVLAEQRACRVLTPHPGKESGLVVEFQDVYRKGDQPILIHHLFGERHYRQGGYVLAPEKKKLEEEAKIIAGQPIIIIGDLKVSSEIRTVIEIGRINADVEFTVDFVREILASKTELEQYVLMQFSDFKELQFEHPNFWRKGDTLLRNYFGILWNNNKEDFEIFKQEVLEEEMKEHFIANTESIIELPEQEDPLQAASQTELAEGVRKVLSRLNSKEEKIIRMRFGVGLDREYSLDEVGKEFNVTGNRIRDIENQVLRKLRHPYNAKLLKELTGETFRPGTIFFNNRSFIKEVLDLERSVDPSHPGYRSVFLQGTMLEEVETAELNALIDYKIRGRLFLWKNMKQIEDILDEERRWGGELHFVSPMMLMLLANAGCKESLSTVFRCPGGKAILSSHPSEVFPPDFSSRLIGDNDHFSRYVLYYIK